MQRFSRYLVLLLVALVACISSRSGKERFILAAVQERPGMEIRDLYKLLHQGRFGIGHLISSRAAARDYLLEEIAALPPGPDEPLLEPCSPDGRMVRVNLRPFVRRGLDPDTLLEAMIASLQATRPDTTAFRDDWACVGTLIRSGRLSHDAGLYASFTREVANARYPAMHHSEGYLARYHPAYRVVLREQFRLFFPEADH